MPNEQAPVTYSRIKELVERIESAIPDSDAKTRAFLLALKSEVEQAARQSQSLQELVTQFEEAYEKLTQPANKIGIVLAILEDGNVHVVHGDTEFITSIDPLVDLDAIVPGARVRLNDAYAIIGLAPKLVRGNLIPIVEVIGDDRLKVGNESPGQSTRYVLISNHLDSSVMKKGDEVLIDPSGTIAVEHYPKELAQNYFIEEIPVTPWSAVGGQTEAISLIKESIEQPLLYPELYNQFGKNPPKGILLYGPPGCGKTLLGKAIAYNLAAEYRKRTGREDAKECFLHISGPKILNMWLGETERMVREIFSTAREKAAEGHIVVVFIDEAESVLRTRSSGKWLNISNTVVPQFCAEMDGLESLENVVIVLTSNRPDYIDPAILRPERIDRKIRIRRPDLDASREILSIYIRAGLPIDPALVLEHDGEACARKALIESTLGYLWRKTKETEFLVISKRDGTSDTLHWGDMVSGALLKSVVDRAKDMAIKRAILEPKGQHGLSMNDLQEAIENEFKENEIFPKSDAAEDWLKLLDFEPEAVVDVRPVNQAKSFNRTRRPVI